MRNVDKAVAVKNFRKGRDHLGDLGKDNIRMDLRTSWPAIQWYTLSSV
jgi:hypothetical protein